MKEKKKLFCYSYRIDAVGNGHLKSYEVTTNITPYFYVIDPDSRFYPDHSERIRKDEIEQVFPLGFERCEYYLISERSDREEYFRNEVMSRLVRELDAAMAKTEKIRKAMNMQ